MHSSTAAGKGGAHALHGPPVRGSDDPAETTNAAEKGIHALPADSEWLLLLLLLLVLLGLAEGEAEEVAEDTGPDEAEVEDEDGPVDEAREPDDEDKDVDEPTRKPDLNVDLEPRGKLEEPEERESLDEAGTDD